MSFLSHIPYFLLEMISIKTLKRVPEKDLVMDNEENVIDYDISGKNESTLDMSYIYHTAKITQTIQNCKKVLDLGCGPATLLCEIAKINPKIDFVGIDLSNEMLEHAKRNVEKFGITNVEFMRGDFSLLNDFNENSFDGVISSMALHHLPRLDLLEKCFRNIGRVLKNDGALYLTDFGRFNNSRTVNYFAYMNEDICSDLFNKDYEMSLRAAFSVREFSSLVEKFLKISKLFKTPVIPFSIIIKTEDFELQIPQREYLIKRYELLSPKLKKIFKEFALCLRLGGVKNNLFK